MLLKKAIRGVSAFGFCFGAGHLVVLWQPLLVAKGAQTRHSPPKPPPRPISFDLPNVSDCY